MKGGAIMLITTLPITIRQNLPFPTLLSPLTASLLSKFLNCKFYMATNCTGKPFAHLSKDEINYMQEWYANKLNQICFTPFNFWSDTDPLYVEFFREKIIELFKDKIIFAKKNKN